MHLTICIPIYQVDVTTLVNDLIKQAEQLDLNWDIVCMDDRSDDTIRAINRPILQTLYNVSYIELSDNLGRSRIRNWLAKTARGTHLLYIDADSGIVRNDYLQRYVANLPADAIYGGRCYSDDVPSSNYYLHWRYGRRYEDRNIRQRRADPAHTFLTCNCLVSASVAKAVPFDESIDGYGYEDLVLAEDILSAGYSILHIDNPVKHIELDDNDAFLRKAQQAIVNLHKLVNKGRLSPTRLVRWTKAAVDWEVDGVIAKIIAKFSDKWTADLRSGKGLLLKLQLLKLLWLLDIKKEPSETNR